MSAFTATTRMWGIIFLGALGVFIAMRVAQLDQNLMAIPAAVGWLAALVALRPLVPRERMSFLYAAFAVMAFLIFFLHETYAFHGKVRYFPLIVGWTGVLLSTLDILSLTETRVARAINTFFGAIHAPAPTENPVSREIACMLSMTGAVAMIWLVGFLIASPLFVFLWMWLWGGKALRDAIYGGVFTFIFIWGLFEVLLSYELFRGELVLWLIDRFQG